jgi:hypothetical protein
MEIPELYEVLFSRESVEDNDEANKVTIAIIGQRRRMS